MKVQFSWQSWSISFVRCVTTYKRFHIVTHRSNVSIALHCSSILLALHDIALHCITSLHIAHCDLDAYFFNSDVLYFNTWWQKYCEVNNCISLSQLYQRELTAFEQSDKGKEYMALFPVPLNSNNNINNTNNADTSQLDISEDDMQQQSDHDNDNDDDDMDGSKKRKKKFKSPPNRKSMKLTD